MSKYPKILKKAYRHTVPRILQDKIDVLRGESQVFRPCFQETKSIFIHIPKAAGTSIARAIYGMNVGHRKAADYIKISNSEFNKYFRFSFVRNPWDRAVSAYNFVTQGGTSFVQPLPNSIYQSKQFSTFDTFVKEWLPYANLDKEDVVFTPQYKYIYDNNMKLQIDFIGKLENIHDDLKLIQKHLKTEIHIKTLNKSQSNNESYKSVYTDKTIDIIAKIYSKDIDTFNYKF